MTPTKNLLLAGLLLLGGASWAGRMHGGPGGALVVPPDAASAFNTAVLAQTPEAYWKLNEVSGTLCVDSQGKWTGYWRGTPTFGITGLITGETEKAVQFSGDDYVDLKCSTVFEGSFTAMFVIKRTPNTGVWESLLAYSNSTTPYYYGDRGMYLGLDDWETSDLIISIYDFADSLNKVATQGVVLDDNVPHLAFLSFDVAAGRVKMYKDGTLGYNQTGYPNPGPMVMASLKIGANLHTVNTFQQPYGGGGGTALLEKVAWFNRVLTQSDIDSIQGAFK